MKKLCKCLIKAQNVILNKYLKITKMSFKPSKSLEWKKRKVVKFHLTISKTNIPTLKEKPLKKLGKLFDRSLKITATTYQQNHQWFWSLATSWQI